MSRSTNHMIISERLYTLFVYLEKGFWIISAVLMILAAFMMLLKGASTIVIDSLDLQVDSHALNKVLTKEFFYAVICLELYQISRVRIEGESHIKVLYHFIVMAALTFGREIFLVHNITLPVVTGFIMMILIFMAFYTWRAMFSNP